MRMEKIRGKQELVVAVEEEDEVVLPGFRFHPTDEELVRFYLRRRVEKKPPSIEIIKEIDIYKYDPWDLPKTITAGEKEWYFFCLRGRKYKNSVRPNRVTGSGFWKATGIDRPIHSARRSGDCIGLKKSLVYYRGSAGKGTKTDWMMHEFRLPAAADTNNNNASAPQEAEVWTICRIFRRSVSFYKKQPNSYRAASTNEQTTPADSSSVTGGTGGGGFECDNINGSIYCRNYSSATCSNGDEGEIELITNYHQDNNQVHGGLWNSIDQAPLLYPKAVESQSISEFFGDGCWDEIERFVEFMTESKLPL